MLRAPQSRRAIAADLIRRQGLGATARHAIAHARWMLRVVVDVEWLEVLETPTDHRFVDRRPVDVRPTANSDEAAVAALIGARRAHRHFERGDTGLVAELEGRVVGCTWLTWKRFRLPVYGVRFDPRPGYVYGTALNVTPGLRRRNIGRALLQARLETAMASGAHTCVSHLSRRNGSAARLHLGLAGARVAGRVPVLVFFRRVGVPLRRSRHGAH